MPEIPEDKRNRIINLVQEMNHAFSNKTSPEITRVIDIGSTKLYKLGFRGQDDSWHDNFVTEYKGELRGFQKIEELIPEINKGFGFASFLVSNARVISLSLSAVLLTGTICYLAITKEVKVDVIINFAAIVLGYVAGKGEAVAEK